MVLWLFDRFAKLSLGHYLMIVVTIVVPVVFPTVIGYFLIERLLVRVVIDIVVILIWSIFVVVVVSKLVEREDREVSQLVEWKVGEVRGQLNRLNREHRGATADVRSQLEDLEERLRSSLESMGVELRPKTAYIRAQAMSGVPKVSASLRMTGGSRLARMRRWFRRSRSLVWEKVWGSRSDGSG